MTSVMLVTGPYGLHDDACAGLERLEAAGFVVGALAAIRGLFTKCWLALVTN
jgi:hypothetical protein